MWVREGGSPKTLCTYNVLKYAFKFSLHLKETKIVL